MSLPTFSVNHSSPSAICGLGTLLLCVALAGGCANVRVTDPPRTATEQFLLTQAAARAVEGLKFDMLHGRRVFLDTTYYQSQEQPFVIGELRHAMLEAGLQLTAARDGAEVVLEVRTGGVGIDRADFLLGIPPFLIPPAAAGGLDGLNTIITPEIAIYKSRRQDGTASLSYVAYWADTGEIAAASGPSVGRSLREDVSVLGVSARTAGDIPPIQRPTE